MIRLHVRLFGPFEVAVDDEPASGFDSDKVRALLAYLVVEADRPHRREKLVGLLWPDFPERAARTSLRRALSNLRQVIGDRSADPPYLLITRQTIQFNTASDAWVDVARFAALHQEQEGQSPVLTELEAVTDLPRGQFMEGFSLPDSPPFEEWQRVTGEAFQQQLLNTLHHLSGYYENMGQHEQALRYARQAVEMDPFREESHRSLMQALASSGQRVQALAQYETLKELLATELGVEPDRETINLFTQIESGEYETEAKGVSLPSGTVTFLFSDMQGSTQLIQQLGPDRYGELLIAYRNILRTQFALYHGQEIDTQGDAFFVSFPRAKDAVDATAKIQQALTSYQWSEGVEVKVRMGLHTGEPWLIEEGYIGMDIHRAARLAQVGHGGQVLLSETTTALVRDELPEGVTLLNLGRHRLNDMRRSEAIHQLVIAGLPSKFPALNSLEVMAEPRVSTVEVNGRQPRKVGDSPYRGLASFREDDAEFFFGRETFTQQLLDALGQGNLVAVVVGSSGSGKSSTVFAGLLPQLRSEADWLTVAMRPGTHPFHALATALLPQLEPNMDETDHLFASQKLADGLLAGEISLFHTINRILENEAIASRLLLILDQFEELYTLCPDPDIRLSFTGELLAAVESGAARRPNPVSILLTLRADFMGQALTNRSFADALQEGSLLLGPLNRDELRAAIVKPAELQGAAFEPGLVTRILDDVGDEPGNLPLLEFALTLLWDQMENGWMTHQVYDEIGRVEGALARYADEFYAELKHEEQEQVRRIFIQLVQPGQGTEDTRRAAKREDLVGVDWGLVQHLADRRMVVTGLDETGDETVEVVHEALIWGWGQLREWMAADRDFRNWQEGLRVALRGWENSGTDEGALLRGAPLVQAEEWLSRREDEISLEQRGYIQASVELRQRRIAEQERRRRLVLGGLTIGLIMALLLSIFALGQRRSALDSAAEAQNLALVAGSQAALANNDTDTALALAWQAVALYPDSALAQAQLSESAYTPGSVRILTGNEAIINRVVISPNGDTVVGVGTDGNVISWDLETGQILWKEQAFTPEELVEAEEKIKVEGNHGAFSPDGQVFAASFDDRIMFWSAADGQLIRQIESAALDQKITFSPNGDQFATIGKEEEGRLVFWDFASRSAVREFNRGSHIENFTYTADGSDILLASQTGELTLLDVQTGQVIYEVQANLGTSAGPLFHVSISPDGTRVAGNFSNAGILVWDLETGDQLQDFRYQGGVDTVAFHPIDGTIFTGGSGVLQTIDPQSGVVLRANTSQSSSIFHLAITPDGTRAVTTALDGTVRLWDLQSGQVVRQYPAPDTTLFKVTLSPDAHTALAASSDVSATLWDVETGEEIRRFVDDQPILSVAFSPDGGKALTGAGYRLAEKVESGHIILWDVGTGEEIRRFEGQPYAVFGVDFSPDGKLAASAGNGALAILWDVETGEEIRRFEDYWEDYIYPDKSYWDVKFSPDGQQLFASHSSGAIIEWDVESGQKIQQMVGHMSGGKITFSEDGQRLVSGSADSQVILWETQSGNIIHRISDHAGGVGEVQFSPDEKLILGGGADGTSSLWRVETGEEIRRYGSGFVFSSEFTPDGRQAVVGYRDGRVELWRIDSTLDELLTWTRDNRYIPELTCEQRELYRIEPLCDPEP